MAEMTYGAPDPRDPQAFGPTGPQYPYVPPPQYPYPPAPGGYPPEPPPLPYPSQEPNTLATLSVVFAFVFAPVGAVLGHLALGQIRRTYQLGRDRALIGLTLSYTFMMLALVALTIFTVIAGHPPATSSTATGPEAGAPQPTWTSTPAQPPAPAPVNLAKVLLSLDEVRDIMKTPGLQDLRGSSPPGTGGSQDKDVTSDPPECGGAVASGLNTVYNLSSIVAQQSTTFGDTSTATIVGQSAASFDSAAAARAFVEQNTDQWRRCSGKEFQIVSPGGTLTWQIGAVTVGGDRTSLRNELTGRNNIPEYRVMAARGNVVIDLSLFSRQATHEIDIMADRMLARIPG